MKKMHPYLGPSHCIKLYGNCLTNTSTDNELKLQKQLCLEHEPCIMKYLKETSSRF